MDGVPRHLPPVPAHFTGRMAELGRIDDLVFGGTAAGRVPLVVLSGPGGVGKTALALEWAHRAAACFPGGHLYLDLAGASEGEALGQFLRSLGVAEKRVPATPREQTAMYRSLTAGRRLLVVLDNAVKAEQVRMLVPAAAGGAVLVTSRSRLTALAGSGARLVDVAPLGHATAVALLAGCLHDGRVDAEPGAACELVRLCGGFPIAICVAAARLAARPRWSIARMVAELADERDRLTALSAGHQLSVQASFDVSYRLLEPDAAALYRRLGLHPGREFCATAVAAMADPASDPDRLVGELVEANLLEEVSEDRFRFHDLLRLHARHHAAADDPAAVRDAAVHRTCEWYLAAARVADGIVVPYRRRLPYDAVWPAHRLPRLDGWRAAMAWMERERVNLICATMAGLEHGWFRLAWQLADVVWPVLLHNKHYGDRSVVDELGQRAADGWGDQTAIAMMAERRHHWRPHGHPGVDAVVHRAEIGRQTRSSPKLKDSVPQ
jgi:hypothetical protein